MHRVAFVCCAVAIILLSACSEARRARFGTRYLPPARSLSYGADYKQLPKEPPALDGTFKGTTDDAAARPHADPNIRSVGVEPIPPAGDSYKHY